MPLLVLLFQMTITLPSSATDSFPALFRQLEAESVRHCRLPCVSTAFVSS